MTPKPGVPLWHEAEVRVKRRDSLRRQDGGVPSQWRRSMRSRRSATLPCGDLSQPVCPMRSRRSATPPWFRETLAVSLGDFSACGHRAAPCLAIISRRLAPLNEKWGMSCDQKCSITQMSRLSLNPTANPMMPPSHVMPCSSRLATCRVTRSIFFSSRRTTES